MSKKARSLLDLSPTELSKLKQYTHALTSRSAHKEASAADGTLNPITASAAHGKNVAIQKHDKLNALINKKLDGKHMDDLSPMEQIKLKLDAHNQHLGNNKSPLSEAHDSHSQFKPAAYGAHGASVYEKAGQLTQDDTANINDPSDYNEYEDEYSENYGESDDISGTYDSDMSRGSGNFASNIADAGGGMDDSGNIVGVSQTGDDISRIKHGVSAEDAENIKNQTQKKYNKHRDADTELYTVDHSQQHHPVLDDTEAKDLFGAVNTHYAKKLIEKQHIISRYLKNHKDELGQAMQEGISSGIKKYYPNHEHKDKTESEIDKHIHNHTVASADSIHKRLSTDPIAYRFGIKKYQAKQAADKAAPAISIKPEADKPTSSEAASTPTPTETAKPKIDLQQHLSEEQHGRMLNIKKT